MSDQHRTGKWKTISQGGKDCEPHDICINGRDCIDVGASKKIVQGIVDAHNAALAEAALEIKSLKAVEANYNETHQILTNIGVKHEGMDVAFRVNAALAAERDKSGNILRVEAINCALETSVQQLLSQLAAEREKHQ